MTNENNSHYRLLTIWLFCLRSLVLCLFFSGCAMVTPAPEANKELRQTWPQRQNKLRAIRHWQAQGAMAVRAENQSWSAHVVWRYFAPKQYHIDFVAPLGAGVAQLVVTPAQARWRDSDGKQYHAATAETLLQHQTGWQLPLANLMYWLRGLPAPGSYNEPKYDEQARLYRFLQQGWVIDYPSYTRVGTVDLPSRVELTRGAQFKMKIIINRWDWS